MSKTGGFEHSSNPEKPDASQRPEKPTHGSKRFHPEGTRTSDTSTSSDRHIPTTDPRWGPQQFLDALKSGYLSHLDGTTKATQQLENQSLGTDAGDKTKFQSPDELQKQKDQEQRHWNGPYRLFFT